MMNSNKKGIKVKSAIFGSLVVVAMGLLLAPKSGKELRQDLAGQAHKMGDRALDLKDMAQGAWQNIEDKTHVTVDTGKSWIQKGKRLVSNLELLVYEIRHGALTKNGTIAASDDKASDDPTEEI